MATSSSSLSLTLTSDDQFAWADPEPAFFHPSSNTRSKSNINTNTKIRVFQVLDKDSRDKDLKKIKTETERRKRRRISPLRIFKVHQEPQNENEGDDKGTSGSGSNDAYNDVGIEIKAHHILPFKYVREKENMGKNKEGKTSAVKRTWPIFDEIVKSLNSKDNENFHLDDEALASFLAISKRSTYATMQVPFMKMTTQFSKETLFEECYKGFQTLLPPTDCESKESMKVTMRYHDFWRPKQVRCIILGESHVYTNENVATKGHVVSTEWVPASEYDGPREYTSFVNCLGYGESEVLVPREEEEADCNITTNKGTPQYWRLLSHLSGLNPKDVPILKKDISSTKDRIRNKLKILRALQERGVWLLDTSIIGWYIQQEKQYAVSPQEKNVYDFGKARPPSDLKTPTLLLSWEFYVKHLVRQAASEGHMKLFIPIGKDVRKILTEDRLIKAVTVEDHKVVRVQVHPGINAPNARRVGGGLESDFKRLKAYADEVLGV